MNEPSGLWRWQTADTQAAAVTERSDAARMHTCQNQAEISPLHVIKRICNMYLMIKTYTCHQTQLFSSTIDSSAWYPPSLVASTCVYIFNFLSRIFNSL